MIVCSCHAVNDATVRNVVLNGAECVESITERCGAGSDCGSCVSHLERILDEFDRLDERHDDRSSAA